jgi:adenosine deaminase
LDELDEVALNAVRASFMPEEQKAAMIEQFKRVCPSACGQSQASGVVATTA